MRKLLAYAVCVAVTGALSGCLTGPVAGPAAPPAVAVPAAAAEAAPEDGLASQVLKMTGARTKIVWAHQVGSQEKKHGSSSPDFELMGFDTEEGKSRVILPGPASYGNPSITPDGTRVVFTDVPTLKIYVVDWDGKNKKPFADGFALCTWVDPNAGTQWVYAGEAEFHSPIHRYQLDNPEVKELVWSKVCSCSNGWQVSADGTRMGSEFPHPNAGVGILPEGPWHHYGQGCEGCMAPDNSYRFFHMGESAGHSGVMMYDAGGINKRMVPFVDLPGGRPRQDSWNPRWTTDVRFLTLSSPNAGPKQELYLGEFDEGFTRVLRWIRITERPGQDLCSHAWIDPGLGFRAGEVPLTVQFAAPTGGAQWEWDYGDGTKEAAPIARHTYKKAGQYTVAAKLGDTLVKGVVQANRAKPPSVARVVFYDEAHMALSFDERIQLKDARFSLKSGTPVKGFELTPDATRLRFELGGGIGKDDSLRAEGIYDIAQVPNSLAKRTIQIKRPAWPSGRSGLVFLWEGKKRQNFQYDVNTGAFTDAQMRVQGTARYSRFGEMALQGGVVLAVDAGKGVYQACSKSNQVTVEAVILPANIYQGWAGGPRSIISCGWGGQPDSVNFRLAQEHDKLVMYLRQRSVENNRTSVERTDLCTITDAAPSHVIVSYRPGELACYLNGKQVIRTDAVTGTLQWNRPPVQNGLNFGGSRPHDQPFWAVLARLPAFPVWRGTLEGVAIYSRALEAEEAAANFAAYDAIMKTRPLAPRIKLRARLAAKSDTPNAREIAPYRDALAVYEYDVEEILSGKYDLKKIRVAQWGLIDTRPAPVAAAAIGDTAVLVVEPFSDHPQLEAEMMSDTLEENYDLDLYADLANGPTGEPRLAAIRIRPYEVWLPPTEKLQLAAATYDQYFNQIKAKVNWSVTPGGSINVGTGYGAGHWFHEARQPGKGTVDANGVFTGTSGTVTIAASGADNPNVKGTAIIGVGDYPGVNPCQGLPLSLGAGNGGSRAFKGDIDRMRVYRRVLTLEEIADHAAGKGLEAQDKDLVGDWTFDRRENGAYPNVAGDGLAAKVTGQVEHVEEEGGGYVRLTGKGYLRVATEPRLDISKALTMEAWIRPQEGGGLFARQRTWMWGFCFRAYRRGMMLDGLRIHSSALETGYNFSPDEWTHVVGVLGPGGLWQLWADGKLVKGYKTKPMIISGGN